MLQACRIFVKILGLLLVASDLLDDLLTDMKIR